MLQSARYRLRSIEVASQLTMMVPFYASTLPRLSTDTRLTTAIFLNGTSASTISPTIRSTPLRGQPVSLSITPWFRPSRHGRLPFPHQLKVADNNAVHTEPPVARFANGERFSGGPVTADVMPLTPQWSTAMFTYQVRLSPKPGNPGGNITVTVQARSDTEARTIAASQNPTYQVQACHKQ